MTNLNTRQNSKPIAFILMLAMLFSLIMPLPFSFAAGDDVTLDLKELNMDITQGVITVTDGAVINSDQVLLINVSFRVPVTGDAIYPPPYVEHNDIAKF